MPKSPQSGFSLFRIEADMDRVEETVREGEASLATKIQGLERQIADLHTNLDTMLERSTYYHQMLSHIQSIFELAINQDRRMQEQEIKLQALADLIQQNCFKQEHLGIIIQNIAVQQDLKLDEIIRLAEIRRRKKSQVEVEVVEEPDGYDTMILQTVASGTADRQSAATPDHAIVGTQEYHIHG